MSTTDKGGMMSITIDELNLSIQQALADAYKTGYRAGCVDTMAKNEHTFHVITGRLGGLMCGRSHKQNVVVSQKISSREASAIGKVGGLTKSLNDTKKAFADYLEKERRDREDFVTATEIGKLMTPERSGMEMNKIFEAVGWVTRATDICYGGRYISNWQPTELGMQYCKSVKYNAPDGQQRTYLHWNKKEVLLALKGVPTIDRTIDRSWAK